MFLHNTSPQEGDLYKVIRIEDNIFELRFGYYAEFERQTGEPVVLYPDLIREKRHTKDGRRIVTAIQDACSGYQGPIHHVTEACCSDCVHYIRPNEEIGICNRMESHADPVYEEEEL